MALKCFQGPASWDTARATHVNCNFKNLVVEKILNPPCSADLKDPKIKLYRKSSTVIIL